MKLRKAYKIAVGTRSGKCKHPKDRLRRAWAAIRKQWRKDGYEPGDPNG